MTNTDTDIDLAERIIWSADVPDMKTLMGLLDRMPKLRAIKIDQAFVLAHGLRSLGMIRRRGLLVFADAKITEIPSKAELIAGLYLKQRPWMLNCMGGIVSSGDMSTPDIEVRDGLKRVADACLKVGTKPCVVTVLTSKTEDVCWREFAVPAADQVLEYLWWAVDAGFTDSVCSAEDVPSVRAHSAFDGIKLNTPGIRPAGTAADDQARVATPEGALANGATRLVIGRPITTGDPAANLDALFANIAAYYASLAVPA